MHWLDEIDIARGKSIGVWPFDDAIQQSIIEHAKQKAPGLDETPGARFAANSYADLLRLFDNAGIPKDVQPFAGAQVIFETNNFKSRVSKDDFNLSGIKWINKPYQNATQGRKSPEGNYYAHFKSYADWAKDFKRIISLGGAKAPIRATTLKDYVNRLHDIGYFTANPDIYYRGVYLIYSALPVAQKQQAREIEKAKGAEVIKQQQIKADKAEKGSWFKQHPIWTGIILAAGGVFVIKAVER